jgi:hypothetical protein
MNTKIDKIQLLKDISAGLVNPGDIPADPIICTKADEAFIGMMMAPYAPVVFAGSARKVVDQLLQETDIDQKAT